MSLLLTFIIPTFWLAALLNDLSIVQSVNVRSGPGSYYELVARINKNTPVQKITEEDGWVQIKAESVTGWVPQQAVGANTTGNAGTPKKKIDDAFAEFETGQKSAKPKTASAAQVAAVVKGFARKYKTDRGDKSQVDYTGSFEKRIDWQKYKRFRKSRVSDSDWYDLKAKLTLPPVNVIPDFSLEADIIGTAIANNIAQVGLVSNFEVQEYLNFIALVVAESSHRYDIPLQVHIIKSNEVVGYCTPNGIVFVSVGALKLMQTEAEFAFFIAHELTHVVMQHGIKELRDRKAKIRQTEAFEELDNLLDYDNREDDEYVRVSNELSEFTDQVYEYLRKDKLEAYEIEADAVGFIYMARAGYNPNEGLNLLRRFLQKSGDYAQKKEKGNLEWQGLSLQKRIENAQRSVRGLQQSGVKSGSFASDWNEKINKL